MDKHLDIRNLIRMSDDIRTLKDIMFNGGQRFIFRKQSRRVISLDCSTPVLSECTQDESYNDKLFLEKNGHRLLGTTFDTM